MFLPLDAWNCYMLAHACVYLYQSQADTVKTAKLRIAKLTPGTIFLMPKILAKSTMRSPPSWPILGTKYKRGWLNHGFSRNIRCISQPVEDRV